LPANNIPFLPEKTRLRAKKNPEARVNCPGQSGRAGGGIALSVAVGYVELLPRLIQVWRTS
jgi:hypothetical protein